GARVDAVADAVFIQDVEVDATPLVGHEVLAPACVGGELQRGAAGLGQDVAGDGDDRQAERDYEGGYGLLHCFEPPLAPPGRGGTSRRRASLRSRTDTVCKQRGAR